MGNIGWPFYLIMQHDNVTLQIREFDAPLVKTFPDFFHNSLTISDLNQALGRNKRRLPANLLKKTTVCLKK